MFAKMKTIRNTAKNQWPGLLIGLVIVFALFQWTASALGSDRGQAGVIVGSIVTAAVIITERLLFSESFARAAKAVGLGWPKMIGLLAAAGIGVLLIAALPVFVLLTGSNFSFYPGWSLLLPGLFSQAGIAEETLFRGYLFGHIRKRHAFGKAAIWAAIPFVVVHLIMFFSLPWPIAAASLLLAVAMSFPFSKLYELGGGTIWAPAIVHFVIQGAIKVTAISGESAWLFPFFWIGICALIPLCAFAIPSPNPVKQNSFAPTLP